MKTVEGERTLVGKQIAIAGRLASMTRDEATDLIHTAGGEYARTPGPHTDFLIVGQESWPVSDDGRIAENLERARKIQEEGAPLEVLSEQQFFERVGLSGDRAGPDLQRLYTTTQLSRILKVPGLRIRSWVRRGLIRPVETVHRLDYFDFRQVAEVKRLRELTKKGVSVEAIRRGLEQLRRWFPEAESSLARLEAEGDVLLRVEGGALAEPTGQLRLGFEGKVVPLRPVESADATDDEDPEVEGEDGRNEVEANAWFERALEHEERSELADAARAYERSLLAGGPCAETAFDLGNVLHAQGRVDEALCRFQQAVEIDPEYVEAWNNLASCQAELERWEESIESGTRALELAPEYPDAHYNLAEAYLAANRPTEAREHARVYLEFDSRSEWARTLRRDLKLGDPAGGVTKG